MKTMFVIKSCPLHPQETILEEGLCTQCTIMEAEIAGRLKKGSKITTREKVIFIRNIMNSLIPPIPKAVLIEMLLMEPPIEKKCIECAARLNKEGYCDHCTIRYEQVNVHAIIDPVELVEFFNDCLDANIPEQLKFSLLHEFEKKRLPLPKCLYCGGRTRKKDNLCPACLERVGRFWEQYVWPDITQEQICEVVAFARRAAIPSELACEVLQKALGRSFKASDLNALAFWNDIVAKIMERK